ncbi:MAG: type III-A CRISPR-associated RAMP protein Csm4 [Candidatus Ventricola sp.]
MDYYLFKLRFEGAVHFGAADSALSLQTSADHFCADTLFSALCHTAGSLWGKAGIERLCAQVQAGELILSDSMPWRESGGEDVYYLPKPCAVSQVKQEIPSDLRKAMKRLSWIPVRDMDAFHDSLVGKALYCPQEEPFGEAGARTQAAVFDGRDTVPYQVGTFRFFPSCGLYVLAGCASDEQAEQLKTLLHALGMSGIGGKVSAGYGAFSVEDVVLLNEPFDAQTQWLYEALVCPQPKHYLLLTTSLPSDDELEAALSGAMFQLARRGGYVQSETFADEPQRKRTQVFLAAGAMLARPFSGALYIVANGVHPVYRYAKPMMLGVGF